MVLAQLQSASQALDRCPKPRKKALQASGRSKTHDLAHHQAQVEPGRVNQKALENVLLPSEMRSSHLSGVVAVGEAPLDQFPATTHQ